MRVEILPGITSDQLRRVVKHRGFERTDLGNPATVIHVGTIELRSSNLDYVMGDIYDFINTAMSKFSSSWVILTLSVPN
jgi:hypothetical protein